MAKLTYKPDFAPFKISSVPYTITRIVNGPWPALASSAQLQQDHRSSLLYIYKKIIWSYLTDVALRVEDDDVEFWGKETGEGDSSAQTDGDAHGCNPQRQMARRTAEEEKETINRRRREQ